MKIFNYPGDYALKDSDGYFWLLGRADDMLKSCGTQNWYSGVGE